MVKDFHKTVTQLKNVLRNEKQENVKELATFSADISELQKRRTNSKFLPKTQRLISSHLRGR